MSTCRRFLLENNRQIWPATEIAAQIPYPVHLLSKNRHPEITQLDFDGQGPTAIVTAIRPKGWGSVHPR